MLRKAASATVPLMPPFLNRASKRGNRRDPLDKPGDRHTLQRQFFSLRLSRETRKEQSFRPSPGIVGFRLPPVHTGSGFAPTTSCSAQWLPRIGVHREHRSKIPSDLLALGKNTNGRFKITSASHPVLSRSLTVSLAFRAGPPRPLPPRPRWPSSVLWAGYPPTSMCREVPIRAVPEIDCGRGAGTGNLAANFFYFHKCCGRIDTPARSGQNQGKRQKSKTAPHKKQAKGQVGFVWEFSNHRKVNN